MENRKPDRQQPASNAPASEGLRALVTRNRRGEAVGVYAVCSAHPWVIDAAIQQAREDGSVLHVESTSSQVNQLGGYSGQTPQQFAAWLHKKAEEAGVAHDQILIGGDHLGPFPWRNSPAAEALSQARELVRACVLAGYSKIHLDTSMACADDQSLDEETVAQRAAALCQSAEEAYAELPAGSPRLLYVAGTEVPAPGGESLPGEAPAVTSVEHVQRTLATFRSAFAARGLQSAWERAIGLVVQPGVEFGENSVFDYDRRKERALVHALPAHPALVYEAHSTDYQKTEHLAEMVEDHFAILKVGPWLTFAFREAVFALSMMERELFGSRKDVQLSAVREALDAAMVREPGQWRSYYHGDEQQIRLARAYSYSDRCRYYWHCPPVQQELERLLANLADTVIPGTLISQYLAPEYEALRAGTLRARAPELIQHHIRRILREYASARRAR
ncbi:MAG TPA: class II D-tagatose-bisphosphate aldolase, non-catalytic subunit [Terriglobales bacterium]|nr:class II D-tagatose-bisphosphate aldolase, non-catalytic subunit [Terriglobales bacterium]